MRGRVVPLRAGNESGTAAAEFAVTLPAVLLVLALCIGGVQASALHVRLQDAAADAARATARGDDPSVVAARVQAAAPGATIDTRREEGLVCTRLSVSARLAGLELGLRLSARGCALDDGAGT